MDGIAGIQPEWEPPSTPEVESPPNAIAAYRRFLLGPGVENDFHAMRALAQRALWSNRELRRLRDQAAAAEVEAGRLARAHDDDQRRFGFATGTSIATALAAIDAVPAFLAAQAFGLDLWTTVGITTVLVAALAAAMWVTSHHHGGRRRGVVIAGLAAGLAAIGALRWWYLVVTTGDLTSALIEAVGLTIFTALLVWFGVIVLGQTMSRRVSQAERRARSLRRQARRAADAEAVASRRAGVAMREYVGRAQVFASRELDDPEARGGFLDHVRHEIEPDADPAVEERAGEGG